MGIVSRGGVGGKTAGEREGWAGSAPAIQAEPAAWGWGLGGRRQKVDPGRGRSLRRHCSRLPAQIQTPPCLVEFRRCPAVDESDWAMPPDELTADYFKHRLAPRQRVIHFLPDTGCNLLEQAAEDDAVAPVYQAETELDSVTRLFRMLIVLRRIHDLVAGGICALSWPTAVSRPGTDTCTLHVRAVLLIQLALERDLVVVPALGGGDVIQFDFHNPPSGHANDLGITRRPVFGRPGACLR